MERNYRFSYPKLSGDGNGLIRRQGNSYEVEQPRLGFGPHLILDGYGARKESLINLTGIYNLLDRLPEQIGMTKIMPPYVFKYSGVKPEDWGVSGFVLIAESHISIHTFPEKNFLSVDIFSCKNFDTDWTLRYLTKAFSIRKYEIKLLDRGTEFPKENGAAASVVVGDRRIVRERASAVSSLENRLATG